MLQPGVLKRNPMAALPYHELDLKSLNAASYADASLASCCGLSAQMGYAAPLTGKAMRGSLTQLSSSKLKRTARSVMPVEARAFASGLDFALLLLSTTWRGCSSSMRLSRCSRPPSHCSMQQRRRRDAAACSYSLQPVAAGGSVDHQSPL